MGSPKNLYWGGQMETNLFIKDLELGLSNELVRFAADANFRMGPRKQTVKSCNRISPC